MYIAGLYLSHAQGVESIVCLTTAAQFFIASRQHKATARRAETEGGSIVKMPTSVVGRIVTPIQIASFVVPTVVYFASVVTNRMVQPAWMQRWRLPLEVSVGQEAWLRTAACLAAFGMLRAMSATFGYLGKQYHYIGVREKPSVVSTGPYGIVRHPLYSIVLAQHLVNAVLFWSYVPIIALGVNAAVFAVKMPIEEKVIVDSPDIGPEYVRYRQKVTSRIIPYIW